MAEVKNCYYSNLGNTVKILPFFDKGFKFHVLDMEETIGGKIAGGVVELSFIGEKDSLEALTEENEIDIEIGTVDSGAILKIHGIKNYTKWEKNKFIFAFICAPDVNFYTERDYNTYTSLDDAINSLWKGEKDIRCESDVSGEVALNQQGMLNNDFLSYVLTSYKSNSIFSYSLDGLILKELLGKDSMGKPEDGSNGPSINIISGGSMVRTETETGNTEVIFNYDPNFYKEVKEQTELESKYFSVQIQNGVYRIIDTKNSLIRANALANQKIYDSKMSNQLTVVNNTKLLPYRIGDAVKYIDPKKEYDKVPFDIYFISKISYHIRGEMSINSTEKDPEPFSVTYTLHGLQNNEGKVLAMTEGDDPIKNK